jgi:hypothetical protein
MEEETRDEIIDIINHEEEIVKEEIVKEEEIKPKAKPRPSRAKPKVKISKEPVELIVVEEAIVEVVEPPKKVDKLKEIVECPDCKMKMTVHTLKYIHKRRGFCKAEVVPEKTPEPIVQQQQQPKPITDDTVNDYIKQNPDIVTNYLRNERILKAQKKQSHARSLLNNAF